MRYFPAYLVAKMRGTVFIEVANVARFSIILLGITVLVVSAINKVMLKS